MSDSEDLNDVTVDNSEEAGAKRRRVQRACDMCRRKKIRCDGSTKPGNRCTNCQQFNLSCTYVEAAKKRGPPKGYVESIEKRLVRMEKILVRLAPGMDFTSELGAPINRESFSIDEHKKHEPSEDRPPSKPSKASPAASISSRVLNHSSVGASENGYDTDSDDPDEKELRRHMFGMKLVENEQDKGFMGKASGIQLIGAVREFKYSGAGIEDSFEHSLMARQRPIYWKVPSWEQSDLSTPLTNDDGTQAWKLELWPAPDLAPKLIDLYFSIENIMWPIVNRRWFTKDYEEKLYEKDPAFAAVCYLIFALGCRNVTNDDPRVFADMNDGDDDGMHKFSAGWHFFQEVFKLPCPLLATVATLHELQSIALLALFSVNSCQPRLPWSIIGIGVRNCLDLGLHRRYVLKVKPPQEREQFTRVFWTFYWLDRFMASIMGRPVAIQDEDIDVDFPLEVDEEYWPTDPNEKLSQPKDKPSKVSFMVAMCKLHQINGYVLRTIYSINKSKMLLKFNTPDAQQHIIAEIDSALNNWLNEVPEHLKWDASMPDQLFFRQSGQLYSAYYQSQILVHRSFIPTARKPSPLAFPSLAICTNAARSGIHVIDCLRSRNATEYFFLLPNTFIFAIIILINIWGGKALGEPQALLKDIQKVSAYLMAEEERYILAGRLRDILSELASYSTSVRPPATSVPPATSNTTSVPDASLKRSRETTESDPAPVLNGVHQIPRSRTSSTNKGSTAAASTARARARKSGAEQSQAPSFSTTATTTSNGTSHGPSPSNSTGSGSSNSYPLPSSSRSSFDESPVGPTTVNGDMSLFGLGFPTGSPPVANNNAQMFDWSMLGNSPQSDAARQSNEHANFLSLVSNPQVPLFGAIDSFDNFINVLGAADLSKAENEPMLPFYGINQPQQSQQTTFPDTTNQFPSTTNIPASLPHESGGSVNPSPMNFWNSGSINTSYGNGLNNSTAVPQSAMGMEDLLAGNINIMPHLGQPQHQQPYFNQQETQKQQQPLSGAGWPDAPNAYTAEDWNYMSNFFNQQNNTQ